MTKIFLPALLFFNFIVASVFCIPSPSYCNGFRVTSPIASSLQWTSGQCYQISYDLGSNTAGGSNVMVDLYSAQNDTKVDTLIASEPTNLVGATRLFNLNVTNSGNYYYIVTFVNGRNCAPMKSTSFQVTYNPASPPAIC